MNKSLKTLLLVSTIILPLSACGHMHGKGGSAANQCKVSPHLEKAQKGLATVTSDLQAAATEAKDADAKKRLGKLAKESEKLSASIGKCKKMCDAKHEAKDAKAAAKPAHKKAHHAKPAAPVAAPAATPADTKKAK